MISYYDREIKSLCKKRLKISIFYFQLFTVANYFFKKLLLKYLLHLEDQISVIKKKKKIMRKENSKIILKRFYFFIKLLLLNIINLYYISIL